MFWASRLHVGFQTLRKGFAMRLGQRGTQTQDESSCTFSGQQNDFQIPRMIIVSQGNLQDNVLRKLQDHLQIDGPIHWGD